MLPTSPRHSDYSQTGILHQVRGETPDEARLAVLRLARTAAERGDLCILASTAAPTDLADLADRIGFDLAGAVRRGSFQLLRTPAALFSDRLPDDVRSRAVSDLAAQVCTRRPALFALDDLETLDRFETPGAFEAVLDALHAELAAHTIPLILASVGADPAQRSGASPASVRSARPDSPPAPPATVDTEMRGDGAALPNSGIEYLDLQVPHLEPPAADPFMVNAEATRPLGQGHFVSSEMDAVPSRRYDPPGPNASAYHATTADALLETDLFEHVDVVSTPGAFDMEPEPEPLPVSESSAPDPRLVFIEALDKAMAAHEAVAWPFLAVALRMPPEHPSAQRFHLVLSALKRALGDGAVLLGDEERRRAVWIMPDTTPKAATPIFAALKRFLQDATPEADLLMQLTSAALIPNGRPFASAEAFLAAVFDSEA